MKIFFHVTDQRGRRTRGIPNQLMAQNNRATRVNPAILPSLQEAESDYYQNGGR